MKLDPTLLATVILVTLAAGGAAYALIYPYLSGEARGEKRQKALVNAAAGSDRASRIAAAGQQNRREKITLTIKEIEQRRNEASKLTLERRITRAGLTWDKRKFFTVSIIIGVGLAATLYMMSGEPILGGAGLLVGTLGLPRWMLSYLAKRRMAKFVEELPNAMDVIVRGIRSGLPLNDCIRMIGLDAAEPLRSEFRAVTEAQAVGMPIGEAVMKIYERVPVPEANFFGIVISIQQKSGGNLSEVLGNLSKVIRERKKMRGKISAMSMEAKASAAIIGSLPILVGMGIYASSPAYISLLWETIAGRIWMGVGGLMMTMGILVMRKMINFEV